MNRKGVPIVISGFSGAGKGTVVKKLISEYDNYALSISKTTRNPRVGEENGREYFFVTRDEFEKSIEEKDFLEYAEYNGNYYGTPISYVRSKLDEGKDVILEIEVQGAFQVKELIPETVLVFITPPSAQILKKRLTDRGTEDAETINNRLKIAEKECLLMEKYDFVIVNDDLAECVENVHNTIQSTHNEAFRCVDLIEEIKKDFKDINGGV